MQTELCLMTLREVILILEDTCKDSMDTIIFSIASGLAVQIFECVDYLHSLTPQILHRDLKPENIMITMGPKNRCVKLADFGLSTYHKFIEESHTKYIGTEKYRAPELNCKTYETKADVYSLGIIMGELFSFDFNDKECRVDDLVQTNYCKAKDVFIKCLGVVPKNRPSCTIILSMKGLWSYNALECDLFESIETISEIKEFFTTLSKMCENKMMEAIKLIDSEEQFEQLYENYKQTVEHEINNYKTFIKNKLLINPFLQQFNKKITTSEKFLKGLLKDQIDRQKSETEIILNEIKIKYKEDMSNFLHIDRQTSNQELRQQHDNIVDSIIKHFENKTLSQTKEKIDDLIKSTLEMCFMDDKKNSAAVISAINHYESAIEKQFEKIQNLDEEQLIKRRLGLKKEASNIFVRECVYGSEADREWFKHEFAHKLYEMNAMFKQKIDENERLMLEHTMNLIKSSISHYNTLMTQNLEKTLDEKWLKKFHELTVKTSVNFFTNNCINNENQFIETYRNEIKTKLDLIFNEYLAQNRENNKKIEKQYSIEVLNVINKYTKDMEKIMFHNQFIQDEEFSRIDKQVSERMINEFKSKEWEKTENFSDYVCELSNSLSEEYIRLLEVNAKTREIVRNDSEKDCKKVWHEKHNQTQINEFKELNRFKLSDPYLINLKTVINNSFSNLKKKLELIDRITAKKLSDCLEIEEKLLETREMEAMAKKNSDSDVLLAISHYENAIEKHFEKIQGVSKYELIKRRIGIEKEASNIFLRRIYSSEADIERIKHEFAHKLSEMNAKFKHKIDENERIVLEHTLDLIKTCVTHYHTLMQQYLEETLDEKLFKKLHKITLNAFLNMFTDSCINKENRFIETYRNELKAKLVLCFFVYFIDLRKNIDTIEKQYSKEVLKAINRYTKDMEKIMFDDQFIEDEELSRIGKEIIGSCDQRI